MHDFLQTLRLNDVQTFLWTGHPPIIIQLIAFNTILMVILILRRARTVPNSRRHITYVLQWIIIATNLAVFCQEQWMPYFDKSKDVFMDQIYHITRPY